MRMWYWWNRKWCEKITFILVFSCDCRVNVSSLLSFSRSSFMFSDELGMHDAPFLSLPFRFSFLDGWHMGHLFCLVGELSFWKVISSSVKLCCDSSTQRLRQHGLSCKGLGRNPEESPCVQNKEPADATLCFVTEMSFKPGCHSDCSELICIILYWPVRPVRSY